MQKDHVFNLFYFLYTLILNELHESIQNGSNKTFIIFEKYSVKHYIGLQ